MASVFIRAEYKGGENDKENLLQQVAKVNQLSSELYKAIMDLNFNAVRLKMEDAPSERESDEACDS